jgi:hypothetical protein
MVAPGGNTRCALGSASVMAAARAWSKRVGSASPEQRSPPISWRTVAGRSRGYRGRDGCWRRSSETPRSCRSPARSCCWNSSRWRNRRSAAKATAQGGRADCPARTRPVPAHRDPVPPPPRPRRAVPLGQPILHRGQQQITNVAVDRTEVAHWLRPLRLLRLFYRAAALPSGTGKVRQAFRRPTIKHRAQ